MQLDKFDEALSTITKNSMDTGFVVGLFSSSPRKSLFRDLIFERAYCEYRLNRIGDAYNTLTSLGRDLDEREKELLAQVVSKDIVFSFSMIIFF